MKKLMIAAAIVCAAACANAAAFSWEGFDIKDINGGDYTGTAILHCADTGFESISSTGSVTEGELVGTDFSSTLFVNENYYNFYWTSTDAEGNTYKSETISSQALTVGTGSIAFEGNGTWTPAPEPTSGILLLLGMAGLALKRRRA